MPRKINELQYLAVLKQMYNVYSVNLVKFLLPPWKQFIPNIKVLSHSNE